MHSPPPLEFIGGWLPVQALDDISPVSSEENYKTDDWEYEASFDSDVSGIQKNLETEKTRFLHGFDGQAHQSPSPTAIAKRTRLVFLGLVPSPQLDGEWRGWNWSI